MKLSTIIDTKPDSSCCTLRIRIKTSKSDFELPFPELSIETLISVLERIAERPSVPTIYYLDPTLDCGFDYDPYTKKTTIFVNGKFSDTGYSLAIVKHKKIEQLLNILEATKEHLLGTEM
jgi:hypothetical protein